MYGEYSRYQLSSIIRDDTDQVLLGPRTFIDYGEDDDVIAHRVMAGDTLFSLAALYFHALPTGSSMWWAIADYQPEPLLDPTLELTVGSIILIPPLDTLQGILLAPDSEDEAIL